MVTAKSKIKIYADYTDGIYRMPVLLFSCCLAKNLKHDLYLL